MKTGTFARLEKEIVSNMDSGQTLDLDERECSNVCLQPRFRRLDSVAR